MLIATGSRPLIPPIPGLDATPFLTSDLLDADEQGRLTELPASLIVLGSGYVAVELAQNVQSPREPSQDRAALG